MTTGIVGNSGLDIRAVAPNSPSDIVNAKLAATSNALPIKGRSILRRTSLGEAPRTAAACLNRGFILRRAGVKLLTTNGKATNV